MFKYLEFEIRLIWKKKIIWLIFDIDIIFGFFCLEVSFFDMWIGDGYLYKDLKKDNNYKCLLILKK